MAKEIIDFKKILSLKEDKEYLVSCLKSLGKLEQDIIKILFYSVGAMNVKEIRNTYMEWIYEYIFSYFAHNYYHFDYKKQIIFDFNFEEAKGIFLDSIKEIEKKEKLKGNSLSRYEKAEIYNKAFSKYNIEVPGSSTIKRDLNNLFNLGLVFERKRDGKIKGLYSLNPKLDFFLKRFYPELNILQYDKNK